MTRAAGSLRGRSEGNAALAVESAGAGDPVVHRCGVGSTLICGDAAGALDLLPSESVQTVVTSPPYWSLRDYSVEDQTGRNESLATSGNRRYRAPDRKNRARAMGVRPPSPDGLKSKDLIGLPWRLAFKLQAAGWWLRSEVIWYKPNAHTESVRDRPTKAHETVFLLSKSQDTTTWGRSVGQTTGADQDGPADPDGAAEALRKRRRPPSGHANVGRGKMHQDRQP